jgi:hypothetical protein
MAGRGIDFEHKFKTSPWAEDLLLKSLSAQAELLAVRFGLSQVKASADVTYDKKSWKEPDLLVYKIADLTERERKILESNDLSTESREKMRKGGELHFVVNKAAAAVEVEFSPYKASEMKGRFWKPKTVGQWERRPLKNANPPIAPNIWVKEEDLSRLNGWESEFGVPILIAHLFDQEGFAVALKAINKFNEKFSEAGCDQIRLQMTTGIFKKSQTYDRTDAQGAREQKIVFVSTPAVAVKIGEIKDVKVAAQLGVSTSKKYVTHSIFSGGRIIFTAEFVAMLTSLRGR